MVTLRLITGLLVVVGLFIFVNMIGRYLLFSNTIYIKNEPTAEIRILTVTGYSSEPNQTDSTPFLTASQKLVQEGFVACPRELPFGTLVEIGNKRYECQDRLSLKYDNRIDVWFASKDEALEWGKQELAVRILK